MLKTRAQRGARIAAMAALAFVFLALVLTSHVRAIDSSGLHLLSMSDASAGSEAILPVDRGIRVPEYVDGQIIVRLKKAPEVAGASAESVAEKLGAFCARMGAQILGSACVGPDAEVFLVGVPASMSVDDAAMAYGACEFVEYAEPNYLWYPEAPVIPNDTHFWRLWGMRNYGQDFYPGVFWEKGLPGCDIGATEAWSVRTDASSVLVVVIDTGIDVYHPDLTNNIWRNPGEIPDNGIDDDGNGFIDDVYGWDFANDDNTVFDNQAADRHGTHCAGTIGAEGNNGRGVAGVAWTAKIMSCKFIHGQSGSTWDAIDALNYASMMGAKVASNSWGGGGYSEALREAIANSGMLFIASAGNDAVDNDAMPHYPSSYDLPNIIAVAASDWNDSLAGFSCYGAESVDLAAPGYWIISAYAGAGYIWMGGTSMATPHVSGAAALVSAEYPDMPLYPGAEGWSEGDLTVKDALLLAVDGNPAFCGRMTSGGRLNVANAVKLQFPVKITSTSADTTFGAAPLTVNLSASVEYPVAVEQVWWSFGDGSENVVGYEASHTYQEEGAYLACFHAVTCEGIESKRPVQVVVANPGTVIFVDDDGGFDFENYFLYACEQNELGCVVVDSRYPLGLPDDFSDRMLVWNTSFSWSDTLLPDQEDYLGRFLDNGGRLLMIAPEYLSDCGLTPFAAQHLHVWDYADNVPMGRWDGIDGDVITNGMSFDGAIGLGLEDALLPDLNARPILKNEDYGEEIWPALRYADETCRLVFTTVPWEEIPILGPEPGEPANPDPNNSKCFLGKIYEYLMGAINIPPIIDRIEADIYFAKAGEEVTFIAEAHDVDGDSIAYAWEFDGPAGPIDPQAGRTFTMAFEEPGLYAAILTVTDERGESRRDFIAVTVVNENGVVFVDDDDSNSDTEDYFFAAFEAIGQDYVSVMPSIVTGKYGGRAGLDRFRVVWNCGELGGLNDAEQTAVADFLSSGGHLFLAGQEVMFQLAFKSLGGMDFAREYLHVTDVEHDVGTAYVTGVAGDPITGGAHRVDLVFPAGFDDWTDSLEVAPEAAPILLNDGEKPCALRYTSDKHRLVFMAVAFEAFPRTSAPEPPEAAGAGSRNGAPPFDAAALLASALAWLDTPVVIVTEPAAGRVYTDSTPIRWTAADHTGLGLAITIHHSLDYGYTWTTLATNEENDGHYLWDLTKLSRSGDCIVRVTASRSSGVSGSGVSQPFVVSAVGANSFAAGPNPASDVVRFYINASGDATLYVYDIAGRQVFSQKIESGLTYFEWYLANNAGKPLANGLYLCYMVTADGVKTDIMRLVISRQQGVGE